MIGQGGQLEEDYPVERLVAPKGRKRLRETAERVAQATELARCLIASYPGGGRASRRRRQTERVTELAILGSLAGDGSIWGCSGSDCVMVLWVWHMSTGKSWGTGLFFESG